MLDNEHQQRLAGNEAVFREVNERIERGQWPGEEARPVSFRCECARLGCNLLVEVKLADYERIRSNPRYFLMVPGHVMPEIETVVERADGYLVVEKREEAGEHAEDTDPRS
jgi:hypothetical protein